MKIPDGFNSHDVEAVHRLMTDSTEVTLQLPCLPAWMMLTVIRQARKHPAIKGRPIGRMMKQMAQTVERAIGEYDSKVVRLVNSPLQYHQYRPEDMEVLAQAAQDSTQLSINWTIRDVWLFVSAVQLMVRHPDVTESMAADIRHLADNSAELILEYHPGAADVIAKGWDPSFDQ